MKILVLSYLTFNIIYIDVVGVLTGVGFCLYEDVKIILKILQAKENTKFERHRYKRTKS